MPTQLTLWPMPIPIISIAERNDWLKDYDLEKMSAADLMSLISDLISDEKLCAADPWVGEISEAVSYASRILINKEKPNCPFSEGSIYEICMS